MRQLAEMIGAATSREPSLNVISDIEDDTYRLVADISKIEALGYRPVMSLRDGVQKLAVDLGERPELPRTPTIFARGQHAES
jgi:nucleoside-diphosphate-sugar epimerase